MCALHGFRLKGIRNRNRYNDNDETMFKLKVCAQIKADTGKSEIIDE